MYLAVFIDAPKEHYYMIRHDIIYAVRTMRKTEAGHHRSDHRPGARHRFHDNGVHARKRHHAAALALPGSGAAGLRRGG